MCLNSHGVALLVVLAGGTLDERFGTCMDLFLYRRTRHRLGEDVVTSIRLDVNMEWSVDNGVFRTGYGSME